MQSKWLGNLTVRSYSYFLHSNLNISSETLLMTAIVSRDSQSQSNSGVFSFYSQKLANRRLLGRRCRLVRHGLAARLLPRPILTLVIPAVQSADNLIILDDKSRYPCRGCCRRRGMATGTIPWRPKRKGVTQWLGAAVGMKREDANRRARGREDGNIVNVITNFSTRIIRSLLHAARRKAGKTGGSG